MVTVCVAVVGPLQPVAVAVIVEVPIHVATYVTAPVAALIVLPPEGLSHQVHKLYRVSCRSGSICYCILQPGILLMLHPMKIQVCLQLQLL